MKRIYWECTGPITYTGHAAMQREIDLFKAALPAGHKADTFLTTTAPASLEPYHTTNITRPPRNSCSPSPTRCASNTR